MNITARASRGLLPTDQSVFKKLRERISRDEPERIYVLPRSERKYKLPRSERKYKLVQPVRRARRKK